MVRYIATRDISIDWKGYLWLAAAYAELNSVKAEIVKKSWDYLWSSVHAHLAGKDSLGIILPENLLFLAGDWKTYLTEAQADSGAEFEQYRRMGRPLGGESFIEKAGRFLQSDLKKAEFEGQWV